MFCAFCIGMSKTGLAGAGMLVVPIMASVFGAKESTGIVLPMLVMADIFGVSYYNRHAEIGYLIKLAPSTILGRGCRYLGGGCHRWRSIHRTVGDGHLIWSGDNHLAGSYPVPR